MDSLLHWNYFLALEDDLLKVSRYIEFTSDNFKTYSVELAHLLLAINSEFDVVSKEIYHTKIPDKKKEDLTIEDYYEVYSIYYNTIFAEKVFINRFSLLFEPLKDWGKNTSPKWWRDHNKVKHHRSDYFNYANLENVLSSISALKIIIFYYYKELFKKENNKFEENLWVTYRLAPYSKLLKFDFNYYFGNQQEANPEYFSKNSGA